MKKLNPIQQRFVDALDNLDIIDELAEKHVLYLITEDSEIVETHGRKKKYDRDEYEIEVWFGYYCPDYIWELRERGMIDDDLSVCWQGDAELSISHVLAYLGNSYDKIRKIEKALDMDLDNTYIYRAPVLSVYYIRKEEEERKSCLD